MAGRVHTAPAGTPLQDILDEASDGDVVLLEAGAYRGPIAIRASVSIVGPAAGGATLEGDGRERVVSVEGDGLTVALSRLAVRRGVSGLGAGVALLGRSRFEATACAFEDNVAVDVGGGALAATAGELRLRDCVFRGNRGGRGGAVLLSEVALAAAVNCVFRENEAGRGGALRLQGGALFAALHCTFADDRARADGGATADLVGAPSGRPRLRLANTLVLSSADRSLVAEGTAPPHVAVAWSVVPPDWREALDGLATEGEVVFATAPRAEVGGHPTVAPDGPGAGGADWGLALVGDALTDLTGVHRLADVRVDVGAVEGPPDDEE